MNYFEMLEISESESNEDSITVAYQKARVKWQTLLTQGLGEQQRQARAMMGGQLESAYETLIDPTRRQQYLRQLKLSQEMGIPMSEGRVPVSFTLDEGYADHEFLVVENPVRHPLELPDGHPIRSLQEYVCRAWENPKMGAAHIADRTLERWVYYAAAEEPIADALEYLRYEPESADDDSQLSIVLDLLQSRYPAPILPLDSTADVAERLQCFQSPEWRLTPPVANFGVLASGAPTILPIYLSSWRQEMGKLTASKDHPALKLDTRRLQAGELTVSVDTQMVERREMVESEITVDSQNFGISKIPVFAARPNRMLHNRALANQVNRTAGKAAMELGEYRSALRFFLVANEQGLEAQAARGQLESRYAQRDWLGVIKLARYYNDRFAFDAAVQQRLVEALYMVGGAIYQLGDKRRSLEHLASLACEFAQLRNGGLPASSWVVQPDAQLQLNTTNPKADWVDVTEAYGLNWTHAAGRADRSHYAGEVPLDLSGRRILWRSNSQVSLKPPLLAYEGMLVGQMRNGQGVMGLDAASGQIIWNHTWSTKGDGAAPVAGGRCFYVADPAGKLCVLDAISGEERWNVQLEDGKDISFAYADGLLQVGTGKRLIILGADDGEELLKSDEMTALFGWTGANPVNLLISDNCCLYQKVGGTEPAMVFLDMETGGTIEYPMLTKGSGFGRMLGSLLGGSDQAKATWAAHEGEVYIPYILSMDYECRKSYRDSEGKVQEKVERDNWGELHFLVYNVRQTSMVAHLQKVIWGTAYEENKNCRTTIGEIRTANAMAVSPTNVTSRDDITYYGAPVSGRPPHRVIAAAFGRDVYYWASTDKSVETIGWRNAGGNVQSIAYTGRYDLVTTSDTLSTSFLGNTEYGNATAHVLKPAVKNVVGSPALYGDIVYLLTQEGQVVALGR